MTAQMTPDEARLRELERDIVFVRATLRSEERRAFKRILDALSAERERGDRAVGLLRRIKVLCCGPKVGAGDGGTHVVIPPSPAALRDVTAFLATQKAEGAD